LNVAGVVAALAAEARALGPAARGGEGYDLLADGTLIAVSGIGYASALNAAQRLIEAGATALVSWGMAGGLDPDLAAGDLCLPREIIAADGTRFVTAQHWRETLAARLLAHRTVVSGNLLTSIRPIDSVAAKQAARGKTGAVAVDMESSAVAQAAQAHGLPFIAVRVIVDTAGDALPRAVAQASRSGQVQTGRLLLGLLRSPAEIAPLARLARRYRIAMRSLLQVAGAGGVMPAAGA
jgi:adenosylhomocysteine nucleosidase